MQVLLCIVVDGIYIIDCDGYLVEFSDLFVEMLKFMCEGLFGCYIFSWDVNLD